MTVEGSSSDDDLIARIAARDQRAFSTFYDRHASLVFTICLRILHDRAAAEDVLCDIFEEIWEKADRFDATRGSATTYLTMLARSRSIDRLRGRARERRFEQTDANTIDSAAAPQGECVDGETRQAVAAALQRLEPDQRQAIECSFYDGLSHSEIADKLNRPLGTVKSHIRQGLIQLRESLRTYYRSL